ncbi:MAG: hypothetical protein AAF715_18545 [Myxococcota bacterium]
MSDDGKTASGRRGGPKRSTRRRAVKIALIALVGMVVGLPLLALGLLHTGGVQNALRGRIEQRAGERINGRLEVGELSFSLFADRTLHLGQVRVIDAEGREAVAVDGLDVDLDVGTALRSKGLELLVRSVALDGVRVRVARYEDGTSNLTRLAKPRPPEPPEPPDAPKKDRHIVVDALSVANVEVTVERPDGTKILARNVGLDATVDVRPTRKDVTVSVPSIRADVALEKPNLKLALQEFRTGLSVALQGGAGTVSLAPTSTRVALDMEGAPERAFPIELAGIDVDVAPGELGVELERLMVGALALDALNVEGRLGEDGPEGEQRVQLVGLQVTAEKLNRLVGRELLKSDVKLGLELSGPSDKLEVKGSIDSAGATVGITGEVDASEVSEPKFDVAVTIEDVDAKKLVAGENVPDVTLERFHLGAKGDLTHGTPEAGVDVAIDLSGLEVKGRQIDRIQVDARLKDRVLSVGSVEAEAYGQRVVTRGSVDLARKLVDMTLTVDADVGDLLARLRAAGLNVKTPVPARAIRLEEGVVRARVHGHLEGELAAEVDIDGLSVAGGRVDANVNALLHRHARPEGDQKAVELKDLDGKVELRSVYLDPLLAWRGKRLDDLTAAVWADIEVQDVPHDPFVRGELTVRAQMFDARRLDPERPMLTFRTLVRAIPELARIRAELVGTERADDETPTRFVGIRGRVPIDPEKRKLALYQNWELDVDVPERELSTLIPFVPEKVRDRLNGVDGDVRMRVRVRGTPARPRAKMALDANTQLLPVAAQRLRVRGEAKTGANGKLDIGTDIKAWYDAKEQPVVDGEVGLVLSRSPVIPGPPPGLEWDVRLGVPERDLSKFPVVPPLRGRGEVVLSARGDRTDVDALSLDVNLDDFIRNGKGPFDTAINVTVNESRTTLAMSAALGDTPLLIGKGVLQRGGKALLAALKKKELPLPERLGDPEVSLDLDVVPQPIAALAPVAPVTASLPGELNGGLDVRGRLSAPTARGGFRWDGFDALSGKAGRVEVKLDAGAEKVAVDVGVGPADALTVHVSLPRQDIKPYLDAKKCRQNKEKGCAGAELPVTARVRSEKTALTDLVPAFALGDRGRTLDVGGTLGWKLDGNIVLQTQPRYRDDGSEAPPIGEGSTLDGELVILDGHFGIPGTKRKYERVGLRLLTTLDNIELQRLEAYESDLEKKNRALAMSASVALTDFRLGAMKARVEADDWLLFGDGPSPRAKVGPADAPRGAMDATIVATGDLGSSVKKIDVDIQQLDVSVPYRYKRAHAFEVTDLGDVTMLPSTKDPTLSAGQRRALQRQKQRLVGKLPVPPVETGAATFDPNRDDGLDVKVRFSRKAAISLGQLQLVTDGEIDIKRRGRGRKITGKLDMHGGSVFLGGRFHKLVNGYIEFDEKNPGGYADLLFARREHNATLRDISKASGGRVVKIHIAGPLSDRKITLNGAGSPGTLYDLLSVHNAGRVRYQTQPDLPASMNAQFPQFNNLLVLSFFAVNLPGALVMDKVNGWADPYDGRGTERYGRVQNYEAEGYARDGSFRVRVVTNPPRAGQSDAEMTFDVLFTNTPQAAFGVGVSGGSRGGGGPGIFFEWSSED